MDDLKFEWGAHKNSANQSRHGVFFEQAKTVFGDEHTRLIADLEHFGSEVRFVLLGLSFDSKLLVVCRCIKADECIRIFLARKADKQEREIYQAYRHA